MKYNTEQKKMQLPEYGRGIQNMVDYAVMIEDASERQSCAETIIYIMSNMFPHMKDEQNYKHKLWDHLAIMSDYKLDVQYPYEILQKDHLATKPDWIPYASGSIRYRHYGRYIEQLIAKACEMPDDDTKIHLLAVICSQMKKDYILWNRDSVDDRKIATDLADLSNGKLQMTDEVISLMDDHYVQPVRPKSNFSNSNNNSRNNHRNNRNTNNRGGSR
ncbi:MAG: DUF4290 domain-containing protein [Bacteroidaceae bacterium]|nr:DUF4290 domain-containing protein [Bacteroidaceae bacterium]